MSRRVERMRGPGPQSCEFAENWAAFVRLRNPVKPRRFERLDVSRARQITGSLDADADEHLARTLETVRPVELRELLLDLAPRVLLPEIVEAAQHLVKGTK